VPIFSEIQAAHRLRWGTASRTHLSFCNAKEARMITTKSPAKRQPATTAKPATAFELSRIRAEGWNAARKYLPGGDPNDTKKIAALNAYRAPIERASWYAGFNEAVEKL
jgi:hypothetical protein